jgi:SAM-dependent methyltransferase
MNEDITIHNENEYWRAVYKNQIKFVSKKDSTIIPWEIKTFDPNLKEILDYYKLDTGKLLEIGCGRGDDCKYLADRGFDVTGIDVSPDVIQIAKNNSPNVKFIEGDFFTEVFDSQFDIIIDRGFLHNYNNRLFEIFEICSNIIKPGGKFIVISGNVNQPSIDSCTPPPISIGQIEYHSFTWFKMLYAKEIIFYTDENYLDCLGYMFVLEKINTDVPYNR